MTLDEAERGQSVKIIAVEDRAVRVQAVRLGIAVGQAVTCVEKLWAGPVIVARGSQEIAVGRRLARRIRVMPVWR